MLALTVVEDVCVVGSLSYIFKHLEATVVMIRCYIKCVIYDVCSVLND